MSEKKPTPWISQPSGKVCPVCGTRTYSQGGIHPQCAVYQADAVRKEKMAAEKTAEEKPPAKASRQQRSWKKKCPKCGSEPHVRRKVCDCGHVFF